MYVFAVQVNKLCDLQSEGDSITSVSWSEDVSMMSCDAVSLLHYVLCIMLCSVYLHDSYCQIS